MQSETVTFSIFVHGLPSRNMYWEIIGMGDKGCESRIGEGTGIHWYNGTKKFENGFFQLPLALYCYKRHGIECHRRVGSRVCNGYIIVNTCSIHSFTRSLPSDLRFRDICGTCSRHGCMGIITAEYNSNRPGDETFSINRPGGDCRILCCCCRTD